MSHFCGQFMFCGLSGALIDMIGAQCHIARFETLRPELPIEENDEV